MTRLKSWRAWVIMHLSEGDESEHLMKELADEARTDAVALERSILNNHLDQIDLMYRIAAEQDKLDVLRGWLETHGRHEAIDSQ